MTMVRTIGGPAWIRFLERGQVSGRELRLWESGMGRPPEEVVCRGQIWIFLFCFVFVFPKQ